MLDSSNNFLTSVAGVSVSVNGVKAPLTYVSPAQINFQVPWETTPGAVNVQVTNANGQSPVEQITLASTAAPSMFLNNYSTGVAWVTGTAPEGCHLAVRHPGGRHVSTLGQRIGAEKPSRAGRRGRHGNHY